MKAIFIDAIKREISIIQIPKDKVNSKLEELLKAEVIGMGSYVEKGNMLYVSADIIPADYLFFTFDNNKNNSTYKRQWRYIRYNR